MTSVYITALSQVSSMGDDLVSLWSGLSSARSGAISHSEVSDIDLSKIPIKYCHLLRSEELRLPDRQKFQVFSENQLMLDYLMKGVMNGRDNSKKVDGVIWGNGQIGLPPPVDQLQAKISTHQWRVAVQDSLRLATGQIVPDSNIIGIANTCNTGIAALGVAMQKILSGYWARAIVVVQEVRCREWVLKPYYKLNLLSTTGAGANECMRPFSKHRDGFVKGEGGCAFLIESGAAADQSGSDPYCKLSGYALISDHDRVFEFGGDFERSNFITKCLDNSGVDVGEVDYVSLYGSGSQKNDQLECQLLKSAFGDRYRSVPAGSLKPYFGHLNHAASAIETVATALMVKNQRIIPNLGLDVLDPLCDLNFPVGMSYTANLRHILKISFGFGWSSAAVVLSRPQ